MAEEVKRRVRIFHCADCRVVIRGWKGIQAHTKEAHGRKPYVDKDGRYPNKNIALYAQTLAAMNDGLMVAC